MMLASATPIDQIDVGNKQHVVGEVRKMNRLVAQADSSVNCSSLCFKTPPSGAVLKYNFALTALECVSTSALLTVLMAVFFSFTQMAKNIPQDTPRGDTQLWRALD